MCAKKVHIRNPRTCTCENGRYLESIIDDSVVTCDEIIDALRSELINFNDQKATCKMNHSFINYHIAIDNCCYLLVRLPYTTLIKTKTNITILP